MTGVGDREDPGLGIELEHGSGHEAVARHFGRVSA